MLNPFDLAGRKILVTGASSGIGRQTAIALSQMGARIVLVARNPERLEATRAALAGEGHVAAIYDLSAYENVPAWMKDLAGQHGSLDGLVHSAGLHAALPLRVLEPPAVEQLWRVNVTASPLVDQGVPAAGGEQRGRIGGVSGLRGRAGWPTGVFRLLGLEGGDHRDDAFVGDGAGPANESA